MMFTGFGFDKAPIKIGNKIRGTPVQLSSNRGHKRGHEASNHNAAQCDWNMLRDDQHVASFWMFELGIQNHGRKSRQYRGPRA